MRNKLIFTIILGMFLISLVSATTTVTLNSPADKSISYTNNVAFNASASANLGYSLDYFYSLYWFLLEGKIQEEKGGYKKHCYENK